MPAWLIALIVVIVVTDCFLIWIFCAAASRADERDEKMRMDEIRKERIKALYPKKNNGDF